MKFGKKLFIAAMLVLAAAVALSGCVSRVYWPDNTAANVQLGQYKGIKVPFIENVMTDSDLEVAMISVMKDHITTEEISDRPAALGDLVDITFVGRLNGQEIEGAAAENYELELGSGAFFEDFENAIVGFEIGQTRTVTVTYPEDYGNELLNGQPVDFEVTLNKLYDVSYPEVTDEFVKTNFGYSTAAEFTAQVSSMLQKELDKEANSDMIVSMWSAVCNNATQLSLPLEQVQQIYAMYYATFESYSLEYDTTLDEFVYMYLGYSPEEFQEYLTNYAENVVFEKLCINAVAGAEGIYATEAEVGAKLADYAEHYQVEVSEVLSFMPIKDVVDEVLYDKVVEALFDSCEFVYE